MKTCWLQCVIKKTYLCSFSVIRLQKSSRSWCIVRQAGCVFRTCLQETLHWVYRASSEWLWSPPAAFLAAAHQPMDTPGKKNKNKYNHYMSNSKQFGHKMRKNFFRGISEKKIADFQALSRYFSLFLPFLKFLKQIWSESDSYWWNLFIEVVYSVPLFFSRELCSKKKSND